jgi:hypothetical protein
MQDDSTIQFQSLRIDELIWQAKESLIKNHPDYTIYFDVINLPERENLLLVSANEQLVTHSDDQPDGQWLQIQS